MSYKVITKDGRVYRASKVEIAKGFVKMESWDAEREIPAGEIIEIRNLNVTKKLIVYLSGIFIISFTIGVDFFSENSFFHYLFEKLMGL